MVSAARTFCLAAAGGSRRFLLSSYFPSILKLSIIEHRRSRVNVSGVVTPSPVGPAIENDKYPSPPSPSPDMLGPFFTNSVHRNDRYWAIYTGGYRPEAAIG